MRRGFVAAIIALALCAGVGNGLAQLNPNGFPLPSPLLGTEVIDCQDLASPYITTCTSAQIAALAHGIVPVALLNGDPSNAKAGAAIYVSAANTFRLAVGSGFATAGVLALTSSAIASNTSGSVTTSGTLTLTTGQWDMVTGGSGGLAPGTLYFLDPATPGNITATPPSTIGQVITAVGRAISTTAMIVAVQPPIQL